MQNQKLTAERAIWILAIAGFVLFHFLNTKSLKTRAEAAESKVRALSFSQMQFRSQYSSLRNQFDRQQKQMEAMRISMGKLHSQPVAADGISDGASSHFRQAQ